MSKADYEACKRMLSDEGARLMLGPFAYRHAEDKVRQYEKDGTWPTLEEESAFIKANMLDW